MSRPFAIITVGIVILVWTAYLAVQGEALDVGFLAPFSVAVAVLTATGFAFKHWAWHWPLLHLLTGKPRLTGTWIGTLSSNYRPEGDDSPARPIPIVWVISQTVDGLSIRQFTAESQSTTLVASIAGEDGDRYSLATVYRNEPTLELQRSRSPMHHGATHQMIEGHPRKPQMLTGKYWTTRETHGSLNLRFIARRRAHTFKEAQEVERLAQLSLVARLQQLFRGNADATSDRDEDQAVPQGVDAAGAIPVKTGEKATK